MPGAEEGMERRSEGQPAGQGSLEISAVAVRQGYAAPLWPQSVVLPVLNACRFCCEPLSSSGVAGKHSVKV